LDIGSTGFFRKQDSFLKCCFGDFRKLSTFQMEISNLLLENETIFFCNFFFLTYNSFFRIFNPP